MTSRPSSGAQPLVSVITNSYNAERFLRTNIESMMRQDYQHWEHLVVDCGSTDGSVELVKAMGHPRLRLLQVPFCGVAESRVLGIREAQGDLIAVLDADDWSFPERIGCQVRFLVEHPDVVGCGTGMNQLDEDTRSTRQFLYPSEHDRLLRLFGTGFNPCPHSSLMFRRSSYDSVHGYSPQFEKSEDFEFLLRLARVGLLASIPRALTTCTVHRDSHRFRHRPKGRDVTYYSVLAVILHALDAHPGERAVAFDGVTSWLDTVGLSGIAALCGRWSVAAAVDASRDLDLRSMRYLARAAAYYSPAMLRHYRDGWWSDAANPQQIAAKLTSSPAA